MFIFLFAVSCLVFMSTITWLSYQLAGQTRYSRLGCAAVGFVLSLLPPLALGFIIYLAFSDKP